MVKSDPRDWEVWQANHDNLAGLVDEELGRREGRASNPYVELLKTMDKHEGWSMAKPGSSMSNLSTMDAFERGYQGGWAK
jgi:hypothetical protein